MHTWSHSEMQKSSQAHTHTHTSRCMHAGPHTSVTDARCVYGLSLYDVIFPSGHFLWSDGRITLMLRQTCLQVSDQLTDSRQQPNLMLLWSRDLAWVVGSRWGFFQMYMGDGRVHQLIAGLGALLKGTLAALWSCPGTSPASSTPSKFCPPLGLEP